jgi:hypothetical protein
MEGERFGKQQRKSLGWVETNLANEWANSLAPHPTQQKAQEEKHKA